MVACLQGEDVLAAVVADLEDARHDPLARRPAGDLLLRPKRRQDRHLRRPLTASRWLRLRFRDATLSRQERHLWQRIRINDMFISGGQGCSVRHLSSMSAAGSSVPDHTDGQRAHTPAVVLRSIRAAGAYAQQAKLCHEKVG